MTMYGCRNWAIGWISVGDGYGGRWGLGYAIGVPKKIPGGNSKTFPEAGDDPKVGFGEFRPLEVVGGFSFKPADLWNLDSLLTTL